MSLNIEEASSGTLRAEEGEKSVKNTALVRRAGIKPAARFAVDADEAHIIAPESVDVAERSVAARISVRPIRLRLLCASST